MTTSDDPEHRAYHHGTPDRVSVREEDDGTFVVRMPIASTGEVRNEGDDPLTREELAGMAEQVDRGEAGVFLDHGMSDLGGWRYSAVGKVGEWTNAELVDAQAEPDAQLLEADARLMDPDTLSDTTGSVREALAAIKAQAERNIGLSSSIGWRDDEDAPGGVDLMEASIVGIPADPRTTTQGAVADVARAAVAGRDDLDAEDREALVEQFRSLVMGPDPGETEGREARDSVTDTDDDPDSGSEPDNENGAQDGVSEKQFREMLDVQRELLDEIQALREDMDDDDEDDDEDDEEEDDDRGADGEDDERSTEETLTVDGDEVTAEDIRDLRSQLDDVDPDVTAGGDGGGEDGEEQRENEPADPKNLL
ncbi:hypothetical protein [Halobaculum sp. EA56]|uniref:hypothetical protein n=1 Tax=Halobaculum sp. EA56 TaxID=3421648 RepID=UPI003EB6C152